MSCLTSTVVMIFLLLMVAIGLLTASVIGVHWWKIGEVTTMGLWRQCTTVGAFENCKNREKILQFVEPSVGKRYNIRNYIYRPYYYIITCIHVFLMKIDFNFDNCVVYRYVLALLQCNIK